MSTYTLPELSYDYSALEPYISGEIMELHHSKHHAAYVKGTNDAVEQLAKARDNDDFAAINAWEKNLAFHLGGHTNHTVFWTNMSADGGDKPTGDLAARIDQDFGSFDKFRAQFGANALAIQGSGWSILAWDSIGQRLQIVQLFDQQGNVPVGLIPVLMLDMWEHSYYLQYKNDKGEFVKQWWNVVDWENVATRLKTASEKTQGLITL